MTIPIPPPIPIPPALHIPFPRLSLPYIETVKYVDIPYDPAEIVPVPKPKPAITRKPAEPVSPTVPLKDVQELIDKNLNSLIEQISTPVETPLPTRPTTNTFKIPLLDAEIPVPSQEVMTTATFTAGAASVVSVAGTLAATAVFKRVVQVLKPIFKFILKRIAQISGKKVETYGRSRLKRHRHTMSKTGI